MTIVEDRPAASGTSDSLRARKAMIDSQLRVSGVNNEAVLQRLMDVAREDFVPASAKAHAYLDRSIPLEGGARLAAPLFHGMMLEQAAVSSEDTVLVVEGGCGYLAALVGPMAAKVETVSAEDAASDTRKRGDFTLLLVDGAIEQLPAGLAKRLADGGRVVTGLVENGVTRLAMGRKIGGEVALMPIIEMGIPVLKAFDAPKGWSF